MHTPIQDDVENLLGSAKYIQGLADTEIGMRNFDALSKLFNSLTSMVKSFAGCTCYDLSSISSAWSVGRLSQKITYEVHPGADGVWYIVSKQDFKSYAPTSCTVACCEFGLLVFADGFPNTVRILDEVDGLGHLQEVVEAGLQNQV